MTYGTATITSSATPAADLRTAIEALMTSQGNWEFVETYTGGTYNVRVWRNLAAGNSLGVQWYLALMINSSAVTELQFRPFEDYATGTHLGFRGIGGAAVLDVPSGSPYGSTGYVAEHANWAAPSASAIATSSASFTYRVRATANGLMVVSSASANPVYVGLFNKLWVHANEFPLVRVALAYITAMAGYTRRPGATVAAAANWTIVSSASSMGFDRTFGSLGAADAMCGTEIYASRMSVRNGALVTGILEVVRGYLDTDFLMFENNDTAVAVGDTIAISGFPYICIYDGGSSLSVWMRTD